MDPVTLACCGVLAAFLLGNTLTHAVLTRLDYRDAVTQRDRERVAVAAAVAAAPLPLRLETADFVKYAPDHATL